MPKQGIPRQSGPVSPRYPVRSFHHYTKSQYSVEALGRNKAIFPVSPPPPKAAPPGLGPCHVDGVAVQKAEPLIREAYAASPAPGEFVCGISKPLSLNLPFGVFRERGPKKKKKKDRDHS